MTQLVHFLSAADRINYGDLLFPIVFKHYVDKRQDVLFENYGLVNSDFRDFGALPTKSYRDLQRSIMKRGGNLVIGGGEVLYPTWTRLYGYINPVFARLLKFRSFSKVESYLQVARTILSDGRFEFPFTPDLDVSNGPKCRVFYNSVGGTLPNSLRDRYSEKLRSIMASAHLISVRDDRTHNDLAENGVDSIVVPDSAILMSDLFSQSLLESRITLSVSEINGPYVFVQFAINKCPRDMAGFARNLESALAVMGVKAILCPIGMAPNHEDQVPLRVLNDQMQNSQLIIPKNIYDVMYLISNSVAYLGTSLHGMLTAYSFSRPFFPLNKSVEKMDAYCKTWTSGVCDGCIDFSDVEKIPELLSGWNYGKMNELLFDQKNLAANNIEGIIGGFV